MAATVASPKDIDEVFRDLGIPVENEKPSARLKNLKRPKKPIKGPAPDGCIVPHEPSDFIEPKWAEYPLAVWHHTSQPGVLLFGERGTGKTLLASVIAYRLGRWMVRFNCHPDMTGLDLLGCSRIQGGTDYWQDGPIMIAMRHNAVLVLDEFNYLSTPAMVVLNPLLDRVTEGFTLATTGEVVHWPEPKVIACCNQSYTGTRTIAEAVIDRFEPVYAEYLSKANEVKLIMGRVPGADRDLIDKAVEAAHCIRSAASGKDGGVGFDFDLSPRALLSFAERITLGQDPKRAWKEAVVYRSEDPSIQELVLQQTKNIAGLA